MGDRGIYPFIIVQTECHGGKLITCIVYNCCKELKVFILVCNVSLQEIKTENFVSQFLRSRYISNKCKEEKMSFSNLQGCGGPVRNRRVSHSIPVCSHCNASGALFENAVGPNHVESNRSHVFY